MANLAGSGIEEQVDELAALMAKHEDRQFDRWVASHLAECKAAKLASRRRNAVKLAAQRRIVKAQENTPFWQLTTIQMRTSAPSWRFSKPGKPDGLSF